MQRLKSITITQRGTLASAAPNVSSSGSSEESAPTDIWCFLFAHLLSPVRGIHSQQLGFLICP
jgi:hypothetical protein